MEFKKRTNEKKLKVIPRRNKVIYGSYQLKMDLGGKY